MNVRPETKCDDDNLSVKIVLTSCKSIRKRVLTVHKYFFVMASLMPPRGNVRFICSAGQSGRENE